jgi:hypothetical protein
VASWRVIEQELAHALTPRLAVDQAAEDARRVEGGHASQSMAPSGATSAPVW